MGVRIDLLERLVMDLLNSKEGKVMCTIGLTPLFSMPALAISIASFVLAGLNRHIECDNKSFISLSNWLIVFGCVLLGMFIVGLGCTILALVFNHPAFKIPALANSLVIFLWTIAWSIVGAVALFKDSMSCLHRSSPIFIMVAFALSCQWFSLVCACIGIPSRIREVATIARCANPEDA